MDLELTVVTSSLGIVSALFVYMLLPAHHDV